jgi:sulfofructose kinase
MSARAAPSARVNPRARWDVLGFGAVAVDDLLYVEHYPSPDTKAQVLAERREGGGLTGTALVAAARLGAKAAYGGVLGDDELSRFTAEALEREGVDCTPVLYRPGARPIHSHIVVDQSTGGRNIFFSYAGVVERQPEEMTDDLIGNCRVLFVDHTVMAGGLRAIAIAQAQGIPVVADIERVQPGAVEFIEAVDVPILPRGFVRALSGDDDLDHAAEYIQSLGPKTVVITCGEEGVLAYAEGQRLHQPAYCVQPVIDTTGAGDVFHGAFAYGIALDYDLPRNLAFAGAVAALSCSALGGRGALPTIEQVQALLTP